MPRKSKPKTTPGGAGAHAQRTDLNTAATQAPAAPTGMPYGAHVESIESQKAIGLPAAPPPATPSPGGGTAGGGEEGFARAVAAAQGNPAPAPGLGAPDDRPNLPVQSGLPMGPGAGVGPAVARPTAADFLDRAAVGSGDPEMAELAALARRIGA